MEKILAPFNTGTLGHNVSSPLLFLAHYYHSPAVCQVFKPPIHFLSNPGSWMPKSEWYKSQLFLATSRATQLPQEAVLNLNKPNHWTLFLVQVHLIGSNTCSKESLSLFQASSGQPWDFDPHDPLDPPGIHVSRTHFRTQFSSRVNGLADRSTEFKLSFLSCRFLQFARQRFLQMNSHLCLWEWELIQS